MEAFFWFFLGAFVYLVISNINSFLQKVKFIDDIKIYSFMLIGYAYEQLVFATTTKYLILESNPDVDKEKIKLFKNDDESALDEWKKEVAAGLTNSLPPAYRGILEVDAWDDIMKVLDQHYKEVLRNSRVVQNEDAKSD